MIANLGGFPDNIKLDKDDNLLVAFPSCRDAIMTFLDHHPAIRKILMFVPEHLIYLFANTKPVGGVRINTETGKIMEYLLTKTKVTNFVTTVLEKNGKIYFSSLLVPSIVVIDSNYGRKSDIKT